MNGFERKVNIRRLNNRTNENRHLHCYMSTNLKGGICQKWLWLKLCCGGGGGGVGVGGGGGNTGKCYQIRYGMDH